MPSAVLSIHPGLRGSSRLAPLVNRRERISAREAALLLLVGAAAAATALLPDLRLGIPGHAILRTVFPLALGLALVPRRGSGLVMGGSALATASVLKFGGLGGMGLGALTSLVLTGPLLDLAVLKARRGWHLYLGLVLAALATNLVAFLTRGGAKALALDGGHGRHAGVWWHQAIITYPVCGILAGLLSAIVWFQLRRPRQPVASAGQSNEA